MKRIVSLLLAFVLVTSLCACGAQNAAAPTAAPEAPTAAPETTAATASPEVTVTDMIGREVTVLPGSYSKVVCIGAGALRKCREHTAKSDCKRSSEVCKSLSECRNSSSQNAAIYKYKEAYDKSV